MVPLDMEYKPKLLFQVSLEEINQMNLFFVTQVSLLL